MRPWVRGTRLRRAFTFVEIVVTVAVVTLLAVLVVPTVTGLVRPAFASALGDQLEAMQRAVLLFRDENGYWPGQLHLLWVRPASSSTNLCGDPSLGQSGPQVPTTQQVDNWDGPYIDHELNVSARSANYDPASPDVANYQNNARFPFHDAQIRNVTFVADVSPASPASPLSGRFVIVVIGVSQDDAKLLERRYDGNAALDVAGQIRWFSSKAYPEAGTGVTVNVPQTNVLEYAFPVTRPCIS